MTLHVFPRHRPAKWAIVAATILGLLVGIFISEYDDAPGAIVILPIVFYAMSTVVYYALSRIMFGRA